TVAAGYAFARLKFRGSDIVFYVLLATAAIPVAVTLIPLFLMVSNFPLAGGNDLFGRGGSGLIDTLGGIAIPYLVGTMSIFLVRQFYKGMSSELAEAARIDGASEYRIFWSVYLPISKPIIAVVAIFSFTTVWDDLLWPLVVSDRHAGRHRHPLPRRHHEHLPGAAVLQGHELGAGGGCAHRRCQ